MTLEDLLNPVNRPVVIHCNNIDEVRGMEQFFIDNYSVFNTTSQEVRRMFENGVYIAIERGMKGYENKCSFSIENHIGYCDREFYEEDFTFSTLPHYEYSDLVLEMEIDIDSFTTFLLEG